MALQRIAIIAGEASGDLLAARLILALKALRPDLTFEGVAGPEMIAAGCVALYPLDRLSVMGLVEVLRDLPALLRIRRQLIQRWQTDPPDLFIGVDAPDFNLPLAARLHAKGIPTVHYVSPSIWAWREQRIKKIRGHIDLMLTLFPFEVDFYRKHQVAARFVGHPLADEIEFAADPLPARQQLGLAPSQPVLALLPGSRKSEIQQLGKAFLATAAQLQQTMPNLQIVIPVVRPSLQNLLQAQQCEVAPQLIVTYLQGQSRLLMQAADAILLASGTAVLEGMLAGRLMVAAYRVSSLTAWLLKTFKLLKVRYVTLPNHLANEALVPEYLQEAATEQQLTPAVKQFFELPADRKAYLLQRFAHIRATLQASASENAALAILEQFDDFKR